MKLKRVLKAAGWKISGGDEYLWECFPDAQSLDFADGMASCVFSRKTGEVYEITVDHDDDGNVFRWLAPRWSLDHAAECVYRGIDEDNFEGNGFTMTPVKSRREILRCLRAACKCLPS